MKPSKARPSPTLRQLPAYRYRPTLVDQLTPAPERGAPSPPLVRPDSAQTDGAGLARPLRTHLDVAFEAAKEIRDSEAFAGIVGERIVNRDDLAEALELAATWSREVETTEAWLAHARREAARAWHVVLTAVQAVRPTIIAGSKVDPDVATDLPAVMRLVNARAEISVRANATRRRPNGAASVGVRDDVPGSPPLDAAPLTRGSRL